MTTDYTRLRNEVLNTQIITRDTGRRLGVVREVWVDIDRREVIALGLRDNRLALSGIPKYMYLESIRQTGDVVLVDNEDVLIDFEAEAYSQLINCEVITEAGEPLGRVRDFQFNLSDGTVSSLIIASLGLPQIPDRLISTYELPIEEVVSSGPNRLIVFEGAEDRLTQLSVGLLENLGIGRPPWEKDQEDSYYPPAARPENQLGTGIPVRTPLEASPPVMQERWDEDEWQEAEIAPPPRQRAEAIRYQEYEEELEADNWSDVREEAPLRYETQPLDDEPEYEYREGPQDVWDDDVNNADAYSPPRVNLPEKKREYYEEEA
ncbi:MAG: photosystem reaction center subunit H [Chloroflexaceae bacterium]|nr:photosystem reaction center subunit H [Chloroflexaceae bacterium]